MESGDFQFESSVHYLFKYEIKIDIQTHQE